MMISLHTHRNFEHFLNWILWIVVTGGSFVFIPEIVTGSTYKVDGVQTPMPIYVKILMLSGCLLFNGFCCRMIGSFLVESMSLEKDRLLFTDWYGQKRIISREAFQGCAVKVSSSGKTRNYLIKTPEGKVEFYETISDIGSLREWLDSAGVNWDR